MIGENQYGRLKNYKILLSATLLPADSDSHISSKAGSIVLLILFQLHKTHSESEKIKTMLNEFETRCRI